MELLGWSGATEAQTRVLEEFIAVSKVYSLDEPIILKTIDIRKAHKLKLPDAIIAATALVNKLILITRNESDFMKITDLTILNPYELIDS